MQSVVSAIANDTAAIPLRLYTKKTDGSYDPVADHFLLDAIGRPVAGLAGYQKRWLLQVWIDMVGEGGWLKQRSETSGRVINLWPIPPAWVMSRPIDSTQHWVITPKSGITFNAPYNEVIWFHRPHPVRPYYRGSGVGTSLKTEISVAELALKTIASWFYNEGKPEVLVVGENLSPDKTKALEAKWKEKHSGLFRQFLPSFLGGCKVDVHEFRTDFNGLPLVDLKTNQADIMRQTLGVPPEILGNVTNSNRATITAADNIYARHVLVPRMRLQTEILTIGLAQEVNPSFCFDFDDPAPDDKDFKLSVYQARPEAVMIDQWRELAGDEPLPDGKGQIFLMSPTVYPVKDPGEDLSYLNPSSPASPSDASKSVPRIVTKAANEGDIEVALKKHPMTAVIIPQVADVVEFYGSSMHDEIQGNEKAEGGFSFANPRVAAFLTETARKRVLAEIEQTTQNAIFSVLRMGEEERWTIDEVARAIEDVMDTGDVSRAWTIARTETVRAANFGHYEAGMQLDVNEKEWLTTIDGRERDSHREIQGQTVPYSEPFRVESGATAQYPGDFGVAAEDINCRCTMLPVPGGKSAYNTVEKRAARYALHERQRLIYEVRMRRAVLANFRKQKEAVIAAVRGQSA